MHLAEPETLASSIRTVHNGESLLSPAATRLLIDRVVKAPDGSVPVPQHPGLVTLTERENQVLVQVAAGLSNAELADTLHISMSTAKTHVNRIMSKLWAHDRAQLVVIAYENGIVAPGASQAGGPS